MYVLRTQDGELYGFGAGCRIKKVPETDGSWEVVAFHDSLPDWTDAVVIGRFETEDRADAEEKRLYALLRIDGHEGHEIK